MFTLAGVDVLLFVQANIMKLCWSDVDIIFSQFAIVNIDVESCLKFYQILSNICLIFFGLWSDILGTWTSV